MIIEEYIDNTQSYKATMPYITLYYIGALILSMVISTTIAECPISCECKWKSGKESVICHNTNLTAVPLHLDSATQVLDLTGNGISSLKHEEFSKAGLLNLQKIFLAKCRLKYIERYAFKDLINLVELDLSYNMLNVVPSHVFEELKLRELKLSGNPIQKIPNNAFLNMSELVRLEMSNCKIITIEPKAFWGLKNTLEWLRLDKNKFSEVEASAFTILHNLHGLELNGNPWNCSCKLRELRDWMLRQNVPYDIPPVCQSPKRLYEKSWKNLELDEFACAPTILASDVRARGVEGKNVTLSCNIDGIPKPSVKWLLRNKVIANLSGISNVSGKKMYILNIKNSSSELTIHSAETQDAGVYICHAENKAGKAEAIVTLSVSKSNSETKLSHKALVVSVLLGITLTFMFCLFVACFFSLRKKRILKWHTSECRREDNYEKIEMKQKSCRNINGGVSRDDDALVTITRKNGDYSVVPCTDTDHENEEDEESTLEVTTPGTSNERKWINEGSAVQISKIDRAGDTCRGMDDSRDNISRTYNSTSGTYKSPTTELQSVTATKSLVKGQPTLNTIYTTSSVRQVPDVIGHSPFTKNGSSRGQSENGSINDINELFCTLPRKRDLSRYKSCDSQSPLLPESRYGSECASSSESFARRLSVESQRYPVTNLTRNRVNKFSGGSLLNLRDEKMIDQNSTPLLDVRSLETRLSPQKPLQTELIVSQATANPYGYHAAQLERFLEEYRMLQRQLKKMKETCDSICQEQIRENVSPCTASNSNSGKSDMLNNQVSSPNSNSSQMIQDSIDFKNFESELTKYLMSRSSSTKNFASGILHN